MSGSVLDDGDTLKSEAKSLYGDLNDEKKQVVCRSGRME